MTKTNQTTVNQEIGYLLHKVVSLVDKTADRALRAEATVSLSQFLVLLSIDTQSELLISQQTIAEHLGINKAAVSRHIDELEARGLVWRETHPTSGRQVALVITARGLKMLRTAQKTMEATMTQHYLAAGSTGAGQLLKSLRAMEVSLEGKEMDK